MIGDKFKLKQNMLGNSAGAVGYVFNEYQDFDYSDKMGIQIIFPNGNYDGFSYDEQNLFLEYLEHSQECSHYKFTNVMQVDRDFQKGYWKW
jgi:hypothetical protein